MSDEQIGQLYELMHATKDIWKTPKTLEEEAGASDGQLGIPEVANDGNTAKS